MARSRRRELLAGRPPRSWVVAWDKAAQIRYQQKSTSR